MQKRISTLLGIVIIIVAALIIFGGVFINQYFAKQKNIQMNSIQNISQPKNTTVTTQPSIVVTSPSGGEVWRIGETHKITWKAVGVQTVNIILNSGYSGAITIVSNIPASNGSYSWTIPNNIISYDKCMLFIGTGSSRLFSILGTVPPSITIISPKKNDVWKVGETHDIIWNSSGVDKVTIWVGNANGAFSMSANDIADDIPASLGKYSWTIGEYNAWGNATAILIEPEPPTTQAEVTITINP